MHRLLKEGNYTQPALLYSTQMSSEEYTTEEETEVEHKEGSVRDIRDDRAIWRALARLPW